MQQSVSGWVEYKGAGIHEGDDVRCAQCGIGPFRYVPAREFPFLCIDHSDEAKREVA